MKIKLAQVLKRELKGRNESLRSLSRGTEIPMSTLQNWSQGIVPSGKNLHYLEVLSDYFDISISVLLFNKDESRSGDNILFSSEFRDGSTTYKIIVEKTER